MNRRIATYFAVAWVSFLVASAAPFLLGRAGLQPWLDAVPWLPQRRRLVSTVPPD